MSGGQCPYFYNRGAELEYPNHGAAYRDAELKFHARGADLVFL